MTSIQRKSSNVKRCYPNVSDISSASCVFFLPARDEMGNTGRSLKVPLHTSFFHHLGNVFTLSKEPTCLCFLKCLLVLPCSTAAPKISLPRLTIFSLRTSISHFSTKLAFQSYKWFSAQLEPWSHLCAQYLSILRNSSPPLWPFVWTNVVSICLFWESRSIA